VKNGVQKENGILQKENGIAIVVGIMFLECHVRVKEIEVASVKAVKSNRLCGGD
jgi:hypothetical protein